MKLWCHGDIIRYWITLNQILIFQKIISHEPQKILTQSLHHLTDLELCDIPYIDMAPIWWPPSGRNQKFKWKNILKHFYTVCSQHDMVFWTCLQWTKLLLTCDWWCHQSSERPLVVVLKRDYFPMSEIEPILTLFCHDHEEVLLCHIYIYMTFKLIDLTFTSGPNRKFKFNTF